MYAAYNWRPRDLQHVAWQLVGLVSIFAWTALLCVLMFFTLKKLNVFRVPFEYEVKGQCIIDNANIGKTCRCIF